LKEKGKGSDQEATASQPLEADRGRKRQEMSYQLACRRELQADSELKRKCKKTCSDERETPMTSNGGGKENTQHAQGKEGS